MPDFLTMTDLPAFDEVHVVSDLHLGGRAGFQGFRESGRLAGFIARLAAQRPDGSLALVLNGDIFDTLAEDIPGCIATDDARETVERIVLDPAFAPVWQALACFARRPGRRLVLVIGNHDLELALPAVQRLLLEVLAGDDTTTRGRIEFSTVGGGFACRVGNCRVFCTHGNEVDPWNRNPYDDLARLVRRLNAGLSMTPSEWRPNAGTRLVKEVMNGVKRRYAWIDLLKPETSAAVGALLVLDPAQAMKLLQLAGLRVSARGGAQLAAGRAPSWAQAKAQAKSSPVPVPLSVPARQRPPAPVSAEVQAPARALAADEASVGVEELALACAGPHLSAALGMGAPVPEDDDDLLVAAEERLAERRWAEEHMDAHHLAGQHAADGHPADPHPWPAPSTGPLLGLQDRWRQRLHALNPAEALRLALLDWLADDKSFDPAEPDETSRRLCASVDADIDFIVAGHTHLERAIDRGEGRAYFNTGTWMRLLRLTPAVLGSRQSFAPIWKALADGRLQAIDDARVDGGEPFVMDRTSTVAIRREAAQGDGAAGKVVGELMHVEGDGSGEPRLIRRFVRGGRA